MQTVDANYWWQNVRSTVRFSQAISNAARDGITLFLEVGGHPVLGAAITEIFGKAVGTLRRNQPERKTFLHSPGRTLQPGGQSLHWGDAQS